MSRQIMSSNPPLAQRPLAHRVALIGLILAVACALIAVGSGLGYRLGLWHFRTGFDILRFAFWAALAAGVVSLAGLILSGGRRPAVLFMGLVGLAIAAMTAYMPWTYYRTVAIVPRIHDITTDSADPPKFVAAAKLRKKDDHGVEYEGAEIAAAQRAAYPDIAPLTTPAPKDQVFEAARQALASMGLEIVDTVPAEGRIEAVDTSLLYGFKDDVVVRVQDAAGGTRVDVRSMSRVGKSDLGMNAKRIRIFLARLRASLPAS
jgi:uncharacterized protein (DUF1499 family)